MTTNETSKHTIGTRPTSLTNFLYKGVANGFQASSQSLVGKELELRELCLDFSSSQSINFTIFDERAQVHGIRPRAVPVTNQPFLVLELLLWCILLSEVGMSGSFLTCHCG